MKIAGQQQVFSTLIIESYLMLCAQKISYWFCLSCSLIAGLLLKTDLLMANDHLTENNSRPNIILFIADDMAWNDCQAYGHPHIKTPNLDQLAKKGMRFDNAYLTCSSCSPSRSSIITGRYPHATGGAHQLHNNLPANQVTFVDLLRKSGYYTAVAGKLHPRKTTGDRFEKIYSGGKKETGGCGNWVTALKESPKDRPFFLWLASIDPHRPYSPNAIASPHQSDDVVVPPYLPDVPETRKDLALYYDEISRMDSYVGKVLKEVDQQTRWKNTIVLFISDNGRPFPRCKTTVYNSGVKTPFIVRWTGIVKPGAVSSSLVSTVDIATTFCQAAGVKVSETFQGVSFLPLLKNPTETIRKFTFSEHNWHDFEDHQRSCHSMKFNYIRTSCTDLPGTPPADAVASPTFQAMHKLKAKNRLTASQLNPYLVPRPAEELYDVINDPHELHNLAHETAFQSELARHRDRLNQWIVKTKDSLPETRRANEFDRVSGKRIKKRGK